MYKVATMELFCYTARGKEKRKKCQCQGEAKQMQQAAQPARRPFHIVQPPLMSVRAMPAPFICYVSDAFALCFRNSQSRCVVSSVSIEKEEGKKGVRV